VKNDQEALGPEIARLLTRVFVAAAVALVMVGVGVYTTGSWAFIGAIFAWGGFLAFSVRKIMSVYADEQMSAAAGDGQALLRPAAERPEARVSRGALGAAFVVLVLMIVGIVLFAGGHPLYAQGPVVLIIIIAGVYTRRSRRRV
jgi:fatty acid desaturase